MTTDLQPIMYQLKLDLNRFDPEPFLSIQQHLGEQGIAITTLASEQAHTPDHVHRIYLLHNECRKRQPPVEQRQTPIPVELWAASFLDVAGEHALPDAYFVAQHADQLIGVSALIRVPENPTHLHAGFTGVLPAFAGQRIGLGLKLATIVYAQAHGYREIRTQVRNDNPAMLRINERLGFQIYEYRTIH